VARVEQQEFIITWEQHKINTFGSLCMGIMCLGMVDR
jgi:hypothetical protein